MPKKNDARKDWSGAKKKKKRKDNNENGDGEVRGHGDESSPATANLRS